MPRILMVLALIAVTVFAVADWAARSRHWTPGRVNRWVWLAVIVLIPAIGPLTWIIVGWVTRAEQTGTPGPQAPTPRSTRPDDNPDAVSDIADRIARRQKRSRPGRLPGDSASSSQSSTDEGDGEDEDKGRPGPASDDRGTEGSSRDA